jgi:hypothetical protein
MEEPPSRVAWYLDAELGGGHTVGETLAYAGWYQDYADEQAAVRSAPVNVVLAEAAEPRWVGRLRGLLGRHSDVVRWHAVCVRHEPRSLARPPGYALAMTDDVPLTAPKVVALAAMSPSSTDPAPARSRPTRSPRRTSRFRQG